MLKEEDKRIINFLGILINDKSKHVNLHYYINNPDETIRWIYPKRTSFPSFLNFYSTSNFKSKLIAFFIKSLFRLKLGKLVKSGEIDFTIIENGILDKLLNKYDCTGYSIFTGTIGVNRKVILELNRNGKSIVFVKIAVSDSAKLLISNEVDNLSFLRKQDFEFINTPTLLGFDKEFGILELSNIKSKNSIQVNEFTLLHAQCLEELYLKTNTEIKGTKNSFFDEINSNISSSLMLLRKNDFKVGDYDMSNMFKNLELLNSKINLNDDVWTSLAHRDFTPWNMYVNEEKLNVFDWELAEFETPLFYDYFHFIFQSSILIERKDYKQIIDSIQKTSELPEVKRIVSKYNIDLNKYYSYYLVYVCSYYLNKYLNQENLHVQVYWLLDVWNSALSDLIESKEIIVNEK